MTGYYDGRYTRLERNLSQPVSRLGRLLDAIGLALFLAGALCYGAAFAGLQRLHSAGFVPRGADQPWFAVAEWAKWHRLSRIGLALVAAAVVVGVVSAITHVRQRRSVARGDG